MKLKIYNVSIIYKILQEEIDYIYAYIHARSISLTRTALNWVQFGPETSPSHPLKPLDRDNSGLVLTELLRRDDTGNAGRCILN